MGDPALLLVELLCCPLCGGSDALPILSAPDSLQRVSGTFNVVRCRSCRFAYLNPRVRPEQLLKLAPEGYGPVLAAPTYRSAFHGGPLLSAATRWALVRHLGYDHLAGNAPPPLVRGLGRLR